jgi:hypothetical protein
MRYHYDLSGGEAIIRDYPVYDAANLDAGELLMLGTTDPDSGADESQALITAYNATAANQAIDAIGILNESTYESGGTTPSRAPSTTTGPYYGKVIINPLAVYLVEQSLAAADDAAITSTSTTTLTVSSLQDDIDGAWVYFPLTQSGVKGSLRLLAASASGSATMDSALTTTGGSSDTIVLISQPLKYSLPLEAAAKKVSSGDCTAQLNAATNLRILQTYIDRDTGYELMRPQVHYALNNLDQVKGGNGPKFYYDILLKDHIFGIQE